MTETPEADTSAKTVSAILVAYESAGVIAGALDSLAGVDEIVCVDNASTDNLAEALANRKVRHIRNERNIGFGSACNRGAGAASGMLLLFVNPDVVLTAGAIEALVGASVRYPDAAAFVPRTTLSNGTLWFHDFSRLLSDRAPRLRVPPSGDCCIRFLDGGIFLIRRDDFLELGGFDENIFLYCEDDDLTARLLAAGKTIVHIDEARATHTIGKSSPPTLNREFWREFHKKRSEGYVRRKHERAGLGIPGYVALISKPFLYMLSLQPRQAWRSVGQLLGACSGQARGEGDQGVIAPTRRRNTTPLP